MWTQLKTLIALRLVLLRRVWFRSAAGVVAGALATFVVLTLGVLATGLGVGSFFLGWQTLPSASSRVLILSGDAVVLVVLAAWLMGMLTELQRSDIIDFRKMLYLPVSLRMVFALNFVVSLSSPMLVFYGLGATGLTAGLMLGIGPGMVCVFPLAVAFYLMVAAWSYHIQGVLAALMENKRRRRFILTVLPLLFVIITQLPNVLTQTALHGPERGRHGPPRWLSFITADAPQSGAQTDWLQLAHYAIPFGWLPLGLSSARAGQYGMLAGCVAGMAGLAGLGLATGYRSTVRFYSGAAKVRRATAQIKTVLAPADRKIPFTGKQLPLVADDTGALVLASWLTVARHPRFRVQMLAPLVMPILFAFPLAMRQPSGTPPSWVGNMAFAGAMFYTFMSFAVYMANQFGADQEGFQALVLLPTPRSKYLLAKNLAFFPLLAIPYLLLAAVIAYFIHPGVVAFVAALAQFVQMYVSLSLLGNYLSLYFPYRFQRASGQMARAKPSAFLGGIITLFALPVLMIPSGLCSLAGSLTAGIAALRYLPVGLIASIILAVLTIYVYRATIEATGNLLQAREQSILATLLKDKE